MMKNPLPILLGSILLLGACGPGSEEGAGAAADADPLLVWIMTPGGTRPPEVIAGINADYETAYPGRRVKVEFIPWPDAKTKLKYALLGGVAPDVCELGNTWTPEFAAGETLLDLTERVTASPLENDLLPALVESGAHNNRRYALPWYAGCRALIYRKDWLPEGTPFPETWDGWVKTALAMQADGPPGERFALGLPAQSAHAFLPFIWSNGGRLMKQSGNTWEPALTEPASLEALHFVADLYREHHLMPEGVKVWNAADARAAFAAGRLGMLIDGPWAVPLVQGPDGELADRIGVALVPRSEQFASFAGGSHLVIFRDSERPDEAWDWVATALEREHLVEWCASVGFFPGRPSFTNEVAERGEPWRRPFAEMMEYSRAYPPIPAWGKFEEAKVFETMVQRLFEGESAEEAAAWAEREMERIMR